MLENGFYGYGLRSGVIKFRHVEDDEKCFTLVDAHRDRVSCFEWLGKSRFVSTAFDQTIKIWKIETLMDTDEKFFMEHIFYFIFYLERNRIKDFFVGLVFVIFFNVF